MRAEEGKTTQQKPAKKRSPQKGRVAAPQDRGALRNATRQSLDSLREPQEEICKLASDMILRGGRRSDVELFLSSLLRHRHRQFSGGKDEDVSKECLNRYFTELSQHWPTKTEPEFDSDQVDQPELNPVAQLVRANLRERLIWQFHSFLRYQYEVEPYWLLNEILDYATDGHDLLESIRLSIETAGCYVKVPERHRARIVEFVRLLDNAPAAA